MFPFDQMTTEVVGGISYRFLPNIWVRNEILPDGATYEEFMGYMINDKPKTGYHIYPAFKTNDKINDNGVLYSVNIESNSLAYSELKAKAAIFNAEPFNIYDAHLLARLMLVEYGTSNIQKALSGVDGKMGASYHGIKNVWGGESVGQWIFGLTTEDGTIHILSNKMDGTMVDTKIAVAGSGYPTDLLTASSLNFDLSDIFLARLQSDNASDGVLGDYQCLEADCAFSSGFVSNNAIAGPFYLCNEPLDTKITNIGLRLRKAC